MLPASNEKMTAVDVTLTASQKRLTRVDVT